MHQNPSKVSCSATRNGTGCVTLVTSRRDLAGTRGKRLVVEVFTPPQAELFLRQAMGDVPVGDDPDAVAHLFGSENGVASRLSISLDARLAADAEISTRAQTLNAKSVTLQKEQAALETRMARIEARYKKQFNALDSLLANMSSTSNYLTQQLANIAKIGNS